MPRVTRLRGAILLSSLSLSTACASSLDARRMSGDDAPLTTVEARHLAIAGALEAEIAARRVPGAAIAIVENGRLAFAAGAGVKRHGGADAVTANTRFRVGSMTKTVTAAAVMSLVQEGKIDLDRPVNGYVPALALAPPFDPGTLSIRQLLDHTAGLPDTYEPSCAPTKDAIAGWFAEHRDLPLWSPPGRLWNYSNTGYRLAGLATERVAGQPFAALVQSRVLAPSGMTNATFDPAVGEAGDHSWGHSLGPDGGVVASHFHESDCASRLPEGGLIASVTDWARFTEQMLSSTGFLRAETIAEMEADSVSTHRVPGEGYGLGLFTETRKGKRLVCHEGSRLGFLSSYCLVPADHLAVTVLFNADHVSPKAFTLRVIDELLGLGNEPPPAHVTPPGTWGAYAGRFHDPFTFGRVDVELRDGRLWGAMSILPERFELRQVAGDTFWFAVPSRPAPVTVTFHRGSDGAAEFFATRFGVAKRVADR
jgi:CubicO group peptidase (beta-lactamase class C family)